MSPLNRHQVTVFGMKRGGQHALINWIFGLARGTHLYLNNLYYARTSGFHGVGAGTYFETDIVSGTILATVENDGEKLTRRELELDLGSREPLIEPLSRLTRTRTRELRAGERLKPPRERELFVSVVEDADLRAVPDIPWSAAERGDSERRTAVIVLRDPYNWLASRILSHRVENACEEIILRWKLLAREALGVTSMLHERFDAVVFANYNRWFQDSSYRSRLASKLGYEPSDLGLGAVTREGGGSSVDRRQHDGNAQQMRVLERYREVADRRDYRQRFENDPELVSLASELFHMAPLSLPGNQPTDATEQGRYTRPSLPVARRRRGSTADHGRQGTDGMPERPPAPAWDYDDEGLFEGINDRELLVLGMKRGGQHGVINWLFGLVPGTSYYVNNCSHLRASGFLGIGRGRFFSSDIVAGSLVALVENDRKVVKRQERLLDRGALEPVDCPLSRVVAMRFAEQRAARELNLPPHRQLYLWNPQDWSLDQIESFPWRAAERGTSLRKSAVIVLRDPYNWLASRMLSRRVDNADDVQIARWKALAREALGETSRLSRFGYAPVFINYNRWFDDASYRAEVAGALGYRAADLGLNVVTEEGGGSSVDGRRFHGRAQQMQPHLRWQQVAHLPQFRRYFDDAELVALSRSLFDFAPRLATTMHA